MTQTVYTPEAIETFCERIFDLINFDVEAGDMGVSLAKVSSVVKVYLDTGRVSKNTTDKKIIDLYQGLLSTDRPTEKRTQPEIVSGVSKQPTAATKPSKKTKATQPVKSADAVAAFILNDDQFARLPYTVMDALTLGDFTKYETALFWYIWKQTRQYGRLAFTIESVKEVSEETGIHSHSVWKTVGALISRQVITEVDEHYRLDANVFKWTISKTPERDRAIKERLKANIQSKLSTPIE